MNTFSHDEAVPLSKLNEKASIPMIVMPVGSAKSAVRVLRKFQRNLFCSALLRDRIPYLILHLNL